MAKILRLQVNLPTVAQPTVRPALPNHVPYRLRHNLPAISFLPATQLTFTTPGTQIMNVGTPIVVQAQDGAGLNAYTFTGLVTLAKVSGPGSIVGALSATAVHGVAIFPSIAFDTPGSYVIRFSATGLTSTTSSTITVNNYVTYFTEPFTFSGNLDGHVSNTYTWAETTPGILVASGTQLTSTTYSSGNKVGLVTLPSADGSINATMSNASNQPVALVARWVDANNYWYAVLFPGNGYYLHKVSTGSGDQLIYRCNDASNGLVYGIRCKGSSIFLTVSGYAVYGIVDSFNQTATQFGVKAMHSADIWDDCFADANAPYLMNAGAALPDSDNFTRVNGELGATANGRAWNIIKASTSQFSRISIISNLAQSPNGGVPMGWVDTSQANGTVSISSTGVSAGSLGGILARASDDNSTHLWLYDQGTLVLSDGANSYSGIEYGEYFQGLEFILRNNRVAVRRDGIVIAQMYMPTPLASNTHHGLMTTNNKQWGGWGFTTAVTGLSDPGTIANTPIAILDGNSIMSGAGIHFDSVRPTVLGDDQYRPAGAVSAAFPDVDVTVVSVSGTTTGTRQAAAAGNAISHISAGSRTAKKIVILYEGTNDGSTAANAAAVYNNFNSYATAILGLGADEVWNMTYLARADRSSAVDALRVQSNRWQRGFDNSTLPAANTFTGIVDLAAQVTGTPFYPTDNIAGVTTAGTTYWQGGLHPTKNGHAYFNAVIVQALKAYFAFGKPSVQFAAPQGGSSPSSQTLSLAVTGAWSVAAATTSGGSWLSVTPTSGSGSTTLTVSAATGSLTTGLYLGTITLTNGANTVVLPVSFAVDVPLAPTLLVGSNTIQSGADYVVVGQAGAYQFTAAATGTSGTLWLYLDTGTLPSSVQVGIYDESGGIANNRLGTATITSPGYGWNSVALAGVSITSGTNYWLALEGYTNRPQIRNAYPSGTGAQSIVTVGSLPNPWTGTAGAGNVSPTSIYITG